MNTVLITGGTGLIGKALTKKLVEQNYKVVILTRSLPKTKFEKNVSYAQWNPEKSEIDLKAIEESDYIIHLAGANVAEGRWTAKRKKEIVDSRVKSGDLLVKALTEKDNKIKAVISSSAIGWYGPDKIGSRPFTEDDPPDNSFLGNTCQQWEGAIKPVKDLSKRLVIFRTGIVLSNNGGAYAEFVKPLKFGTAAILGNGKQIISWIHIDDLVQLYIYAIENENITGIYNAVAPKPVTNKDLILQIAKEKKFYIPVYVPSFVLKMVLGEMSIEVLKSATVSTNKIEQIGFEFKFPDIKHAVSDLQD